MKLDILSILIDEIKNKLEQNYTGRQITENMLSEVNSMIEAEVSSTIHLYGRIEGPFENTKIEKIRALNGGDGNLSSVATLSPVGSLRHGSIERGCYLGNYDKYELWIKENQYEGGSCQIICKFGPNQKDYFGAYIPSGMERMNNALDLIYMLGGPIADALHRAEWCGYFPVIPAAYQW